MTNRRRYLQTLAGFGVVGLAGCLSGDRGNIDETPNTATDSGKAPGGGTTNTPTATPTASPDTAGDQPTEAPAEPPSASDDPTETPAPTQESSPWAMYAFDPRNSGVTAATAPSDGVAQRWRQTFHRSTISGPVVNHDTIYAGDGSGTLHALNPLTGWNRWKQTVGSPLVTVPAVDDQRVYAATASRLYAFDALSGRQSWSRGGSFGRSNPICDGSTLYIGTTDGKVLAIDTTRGRTKWTYTHGRPIRSTPAAADGRVYVGADDGLLLGLDAATGKRLWSYWTNGAIVGSPTAVGHLVYVGNDEGRLIAVNGFSGAEKWSVNGFSTVKTSPAVTSSTAYVTDASGSVTALDASTGKLGWSRNLGTRPSDPMIAGGLLYVSAGPLYAIDITSGVVRWKYAPSGVEFASTPIVADGVLFVADTDGSIHALEAK